MAQETSSTVILAVNVVEIFMNLYFRVVVTEPPFHDREAKLIADLAKRRSLDHKLRKWPIQILGNDLDFDSEDIRSFMRLKELRNSLVHFTSSHTTRELADSLIVTGLADTTVYCSLTADIAISCPDIVRGFAYEIFRARGIEGSQRDLSFHHWFGERQER